MYHTRLNFSTWELACWQAIVNLLSFSTHFQQEAYKYDQEGNLTTYKNVELKTSTGTAFVLKNADQDQLVVTHEEIKRLNKQWEEKGLGFRLNSDKLCVVSILPTDKPFQIDINAINSETKEPAVFRIIVDKITGTPQSTPKPQEQMDVWYKDVPLVGFLGGLVFTGLTALWAGKSESKGLAVGLSVLGAVATVGSAILTWLPEVFLNIGFERSMKKAFKQLPSSFQQQ